MSPARRTGLMLLLPLLSIGGLAAIVATPSVIGAAPAAASTPGRGLTAFQSDAELRAFLRERAARQRARYESEVGAAPSDAQTMSMPSPAAPPPTAAAQSADAAAPESITNNQEAGVDEGGIVKPWRDMLVILRRGRLFTVSLADGGMRPVHSINAFPPGVSGRGDWYDEMLVTGDRVIVIGYSYARGGTEVNRFRISADGRLSFEDAYHLRSNDYYSSRNYASRLIGNRLVYYTPLYVGMREGGDPLDALPAVRKWGRDADRRAFRRIADARRVFVAPSVRDRDDADLSALHSVIDCDLAAPELDCEATAVLGPSARNFYVSSNAVYLSVSEGYGHHNGDGRQGPALSYIYRLPFSAEESPAAIGTRGVPIDQFSFRENPAANRLDVLVQASGSGDAMWGPERQGSASLALLQLPLDAFGDGSEEAERSRYRMLPAPDGPNYGVRNRFVGGHLLYGAGDSHGYGRPVASGTVVAVPLERGEPVSLTLPHGVDRIEVLGSDALLVGSMGRDLAFSAVHLDEREPRIGERYVQRAASEGESRSHAFFYSPDPGSDGDSGTIGLPVARPLTNPSSRFLGSSAAMLFLRRDDRAFSPAGELGAQPDKAADDACQASCTDWYGNARPIFLRGRVFALLGYELVEGRMQGGRIGELRRVSFQPGRQRRAEVGEEQDAGFSW